MTQASGDLRKVAEDDNNASPASGEKVSVPARLQSMLLTASRFFTTHYWILCVLIGGSALAFNLFRLGSKSLWFDEVLSVERARQSLPVLWQIIFATQPNMAFYYIFLHFWLGLTTLLGLNPTEFVVRFPSAIFAALSSVMIFLLGRRFLGLSAGLVGASLYLLNDLELVYAQETRSYALQLLLICIAWYLFLTLLATETRQKRWWACYAFVTIVAIYTQLFSLLILAAQVVTFVVLALLPGPWRSKARQQFRGFLISLVSIFVFILPLIYASRHGSKTGWLPIPQPMDVYVLFLNICANSRIYLYLLLALCLLGLCVTVLAFRLRGMQLLSKAFLVESAGDKRLVRLRQLLPVGLALLCWIIVPVVLSYTISQGPTRLFSSRYLVTIVPAFVLLVGLGIVVLRWRVVQVALGLCLLLLTLHYVPLYYQNPQAEDWNTTSFWLEQHYQANDGLVCFDNSQGCQVCVEYYLTAYPSAAHFTADSPGSFSWVNYDLTNHLGNGEPAVDPKVLAVFGTHHPRIFYITGRISSGSTAAQAQSAQHWLDAHYHFIAQIVTHTVTVRLYATGS
jgi:mannosyltransferase